MDLTYYAEGAARTSSTGAEQSYGVRDWKFDGMHPADFANADSKYGNLVDENYRYDEAWLKSLIEPDDYIVYQQQGWEALAPREEAFSGFQTVRVVYSDCNETSGTYVESVEDAAMTPINTGYGLTYEYNLKVHNTGKEAKTFSYIFQGMDYHIGWSVNGGVRQGKDIRQHAEYRFANRTGYDENNAPIYDKKMWPEEVFCVPLPLGETTTIKIWVEIMTGSNPASQNAFVINADDSKRKGSKRNQRKGLTDMDIIMV